MLLPPIRRAVVFVLCLPPVLAAEEPPAAFKPYPIVTPQREAIEATGINARGDMVGFQWMPENGNPDILYQAPILAVGAKVTILPLLKGYTANFPAAISDAGMVVGRVSKPAPPNTPVFLRNQAYVWDAKGGIRGLGAAEGDSASFATGISRDGRRISGLSVGNQRVRGCLWERSGEGDSATWKPVVVPGADDLGSNVLAISNDGKRLAAIQKGLPTLWTEDGSGDWTLQTISEIPNGLIPRGVNDAGMIVGRREDGDASIHAVVWTPEKGLNELEKPQGYAHSWAFAVNNAGIVVGQIDGPRGSKIGPKAYVWEPGGRRILTEGGPYFVAATAINEAGQIAGVFEREDEAEAPDEAAKPEKNP